MDPGAGIAIGVLIVLLLGSLLYRRIRWHSEARWIEDLRRSKLSGLEGGRPRLAHDDEILRVRWEVARMVKQNLEALARAYWADRKRMHLTVESGRESWTVIGRKGHAKFGAFTVSLNDLASSSDPSGGWSFRVRAGETEVATSNMSEGALRVALRRAFEIGPHPAE